ncbi:DUF475 domain-containing protein [Prochlorococcus sp. MIT 1341]|uniref:DUF475 domain-containing protein n=1 Tax=Prochlorococcus sp. MIT 1341 TaxID=3096221 RepID=UPI002A75D95D|nr:DUF475 domain-containing protein [Prochlorococcus sp. MIT 1341]
MDSASLHSLIPILDGVDRWAELAPLLPIIISLELVLSADNAVALAVIAKVQRSPELQKRALDIGIVIALLLRIMLILAAQLVIKYWFIKLISGIYLLSLFISSLNKQSPIGTIENDENTNQAKSESLLKTIFFLALTDLAFSIDSVTAAVAISDQIVLVVTGAIIGVIALRFTSGLFIKWLEEYSHLELAGYIAVGIVGLKQIVQLLTPQYILSEWQMMILIATLFVWGFSKKNITEG